MSLDLEELSTEKLFRELQRRLDAAGQGLCSYCGRGCALSPCRFPEQHGLTVLLRPVYGIFQHDNLVGVCLTNNAARQQMQLGQTSGLGWHSRSVSLLPQVNPGRPVFTRQEIWDESAGPLLTEYPSRERLRAVCGQALNDLDRASAVQLVSWHRRLTPVATSSERSLRQMVNNRYEDLMRKLIEVSDAT